MGQDEREDTVDRKKAGIALWVAWIIGFLCFVGFVITALRQLDRAEMAKVVAVAAANPTPTTWTIGNNSYIPLPVAAYGNSTDQSQLMRIEAYFEKTHPDLRVLSYYPDLYMEEQYKVMFIQGIRVHHEPNK